MKTLYQAAAAARENVKMVKIAPRSYEIHRYSMPRGAWIAGNAQPFHVAQSALTEARFRCALRAMGWSDWDASGAAMSYASGRLEDRLRRATTD